MPERAGLAMRARMFGTRMAADGSHNVAPMLAPRHKVVHPPGSWQAAAMLQLYICTTFYLPTDTVIRVIGAAGYAASLVAILMFLAWVMTSIFGFHDPLHTRHPTRGALAFMWIATLLSYAVMPMYGPDETQQLAAQRWILLWLGMSGVILVAAEHLRSPRDIDRVVHTVVWGGAFSGAVATLQFWAAWDLKPYIRLVMVGFERNSDYSGFQARGALVRVTGMSNHPIELGVVAAMLLPLAVWWGMHESSKSLPRRWLPVLLIGMSIPMSISRSAVLAAAVSMGLFMVLLPAAQRVWLLALAPVAVVGVFLTTPGYLRTILESFTTTSTDPSVANRVNNYPRVAEAFGNAPWLGQGPNTDIQPDLTKVLDNQFLKSAIELGALGVLALSLYLLVPALAALAARARTRDPQFRSLCAALAGACLAAAVASFTFDSFSFAQFASVQALLVGLCGTCWLFAQRWPRPPEKSSALGGPYTHPRKASS